MYLTKIECEQFAGLQDKKIKFEDGLNIIIGENESGKSTMIDLIYHLLFKSTKLNGRTDANFINRYFPTEKVTGVRGDNIDGVLYFKTSEGDYKISKEWEKGKGTCKLVTPDGARINSLDIIENILKKELKFGEGIYGEIVFASQKRQQDMVKCILQEISKKKNASTIRDDLANLVQRAVMESGGISIDKLEKKLKEAIEEYDGHWDFLMDLPEQGAKRGLNNQWKAGVGLILAAYYEKEKLAAKLEEIEATEKQIEMCQATIRDASTEKKKIEEKRNAFFNYKGALVQSISLNEQMNVQKTVLSDQKEAYEQWPKIEKCIKEAEELQKAQNQAKTHDLFVKIDNFQSNYETKRRELKALGNVDAKDVQSAKDYQDEQRMLESQIRGLNLIAKIKQTGNVPIEVYSATGSAIPVEDGELSIREAVEIQIPGIMEMQLMPQGIDLDAVKAKLQKISKHITEIFIKYDVKNLKELQEKSERYKKLNSDTQLLNEKIQEQLDAASITWEKLQEDNASVPENIRTEKEIRKQIEALYGNKPIEHYIGEQAAKRERFEKKYVSFEELEIAIENQKQQIKKIQEQIIRLEDIPVEFQKIKDVEGFETDINNKIERIEEQLENYRKQLSNAERKLGDTSTEEYSEKLAEAETDFEKKKTICRHWQHIYKVFQQSKEAIQKNPMHDIEENFQKNLSSISNGGVSVSSLDEKMCAKLTSGDYMLTYEILSEGTKDTISLAFRLAMLTHLFPEGGGIAVFDDPFTDMDPKRVKQSCKLIQEYAEHNQVIFITCDSKYQQMLSGNVISVSK